MSDKVIVVYKGIDNVVYVDKDNRIIVNFEVMQEGVFYPVIYEGEKFYFRRDGNELVQLKELKEKVKK